MEQLLKLAENYVIQRVMSNHSPLTHVNKSLLIMSMVGGILGAISIGFMLFGVFIWMDQNLPSHETYLYFGGLLLAISIFTFVLIAFIQSQKQKRLRAHKNQIRNEILLNFKLAEAELKELQIIENNPKTCLALASVAGFILSEKAL